jgi:hypothetical protein
MGTSGGGVLTEAHPRLTRQCDETLSLSLSLLSLRLDS